jgi:hypothetical protein
MGDRRRLGLALPVVPTLLRPLGHPDQQRSELVSQGVAEPAMRSGESAASGVVMSCSHFVRQCSPVSPSSPERCRETRRGRYQPFGRSLLPPATTENPLAGEAVTSGGGRDWTDCPGRRTLSYSALPHSSLRRPYPRQLPHGCQLGFRTSGGAGEQTVRGPERDPTRDGGEAPWCPVGCGE